MSRLLKSSRGFTLLELLVAIAILAVIAVSAYRLLSGTILTRDQSLAHEQALKALQKAEITLQRDLLQVVMRPIRDEFGDEQPAFFLPQENVMEFTRLGWRNPLQEPRSDLQRVRYYASGGQLWRERWDVLDRARLSKPVKTRLLDNIERWQIRVFANGKEEVSWPLLNQVLNNKALLPLPDAVEVRFTLKDGKEIRRLILLPSNEKSTAGGSDASS